MVEIARAFTVSDGPARLVILDEPTSSLDAHTAGQLLAFVRRAVAAGIELRTDLAHPRRGAGELRPHRRDARRQGRRRGSGAQRSIATKLIAAMGGVASAHASATRPQQLAPRGDAPVRVRIRPDRQTDGANSSRMRARSSASPASPATARPICCSPIFAAASRPPPGAEVDRAGGARRRRPAVRRHFSAMVDRREHRRPLARQAARRPADFAAPRGGARQSLARADQDPHARHRQQHPVALRRQSAEGAVRPRARLGRADRADGRSDARRRLSAPSSRSTISSATRRAAGAPSSGTRPRPRN